MKKIYLAASLFSSIERNINELIAKKIEKSGDYKVFLPQTISPEIKNNEYNMFPIFEGCKNNIMDSDLILALVDGSDVDSGVAWELGYASANNKKILCIRTDIRKSEGNGINIMLEYGSTKTLYATKYHQTFDDLINLILKELEELI